PGVVVPFRGVSSDDSVPENDEVTKGRGGDGAGEDRLELKPLADDDRALRRCPRCRFQDDATIVVCVRCGFDFRAPPDSLGDAPPARSVAPTRSGSRIRADQGKLERECDERVARIETLSNVSFVPLAGLGPGLL